jgi:hypothetical protein
MDLSGAMITPSNNLANRNGSNGTSATPENGGANLTLVNNVFCQHLTLLWNFYVSCDGITMGIRF